MNSKPLRDLISCRGFDRFQGGLRSRFGAYGFKYLLTYCEPTDDTAMLLDFETASHMGRVTTWESGSCDLEAIAIDSGETIFFEHHELDSEYAFHMVYPRLLVILSSFTDWPRKVIFTPKPSEFRQATVADADAVADIYLSSRRRFLPFAPLAHGEEDVRGWIRDVLIPSEQVTVAEESGKIIGMMVLSREDETGWIDHLYLLPGVTGRGIGSRFVTRAQAELGSPIRLYTFQENHGARRFYERHGFIAVAFGDGSDNEEKCPDVLYEWRVPSRDDTGPRPLTETNPHLRDPRVVARRIRENAYQSSASEGARGLPKPTR